MVENCVSEGQRGMDTSSESTNEGILQQTLMNSNHVTFDMRI